MTSSCCFKISSSRSGGWSGVGRILRTILFLFGLVGLDRAHGQRFLRQGFSNQEDFGAEMKMEDSESAVDMTREMFLMQDLPWQIQSADGCYSHIRSRALRGHVHKYIGSGSVDVRLLKKRGAFGLRAVARNKAGTKLRAFWRPHAEPPRALDFLRASYDEACRARLFTVELELQLPPLEKKKKNVKEGLPSLVYQFSVEPGSMNPKALVPRSAARVFLLPPGKRRPEERVELGRAYVSAAPVKPGLIDPSWAKGRPIFRRGRNSGLM